MSAPVVTKWRVVDAEGRVHDFGRQPENDKAFPVEWQDVAGDDWRWRLVLGDCRDVMAAMPESSIDAVVTDPPYGLEFMGKEWDSFRQDDPGTTRNRGERAGAQGEAGKEGGGLSALGASGGVAIGGGKKPMTSRCTGCGKRDQFRNPHECKPDAKWKSEPIDPHAAPPTMLAFGEWTRLWALEALRVMKPGAHLLAFGGTRTYHRLASGIEDAGAEIRDRILSWVYAQGFPKSLRVSLAIDKHLGVEPEYLDKPTGGLHGGSGDTVGCFTGKQAAGGVSEQAKEWDGWGTALKPAQEPICVARKPLAGTVAGNVLEHGTGAINVDACRIAVSPDDPVNGAVWISRPSAIREGTNGFVTSNEDGQRLPATAGAKGRWPANLTLVHALECRRIGTKRVPGSADPGGGRDPQGLSIFRDVARSKIPGAPGHAESDGLETVENWACVEGCPVAEMDRQSGASAGFGGFAEGAERVASRDGGGYRGGFPNPLYGSAYDDFGGASRFFYTAKPSRSERELGLRMLKMERRTDGRKTEHEVPNLRTSARANHHPTVKPVDLMRWLIRLVTPPGGTVLEPFAGSGTTGVAAMEEGVRCILVEKHAPYVPIILGRLAEARRQETLFTPAVLAKAAPVEKQEDLFA